MVEKITVNIQDAVADTLFIPLYMRAKLTKQNSPIIADSSAVELCERLDYNFAKYDKSNMTLVGCGARADYFDNVCTQHILKSHANKRKAVVVCVGCGLDNRLARVTQQLKQHELDAMHVADVPKIFAKKPRINWYDMDLPEVMALRNQLLPLSKYKQQKLEINKLTDEFQQHYIADSLLENTWLAQIFDDSLQASMANSCHNSTNSEADAVDFIFVIEGVLIYFDEPKVKDFFLRIADMSQKRFEAYQLDKHNRPNITLCFDSSASLGVKTSRKNDSIKHTDKGVTFKWAMNDEHILNQWHGGYELQSAENIMDLHKKQWLPFAKLMRLIPMVRNNSKVLVYNLTAL